MIDVMKLFCHDLVSLGCFPGFVKTLLLRSIFFVPDSEKRSGTKSNPISCKSGLIRYTFRKIHIMERLFATYVRKIHIMEPTMERTKENKAVKPVKEHRRSGIQSKFQDAALQKKCQTQEELAHTKD